MSTTNLSESNLSSTVISKASLNIKAYPDLTPSLIEDILTGFKWLGLFSSKIMVERRKNPLDTLCATLESKMMYKSGERDMVFLQHRFEVELPGPILQTRTSTGIWYGSPNGTSAMARTVGVPCGIAVDLILQGKISKRGILAPMTKEINEPLLEKLEQHGIAMVDAIL